MPATHAPAAAHDMTNTTPEEITPSALQTPRAAALAGVLFAVLFGVIVVLLRRVVPANPEMRVCG